LSDLRVDTQGNSRFRSTLIKVLIVQVVALLLLWLLQSRYGLQ
jgi:hypothetical protein